MTSRPRYCLLVEPDHRLNQIAVRAARAGTKMVIVSGGDGTIEAVALGLLAAGRRWVSSRPARATTWRSRSESLPAISPKPLRSCVKGASSKFDVGQVRYRNKSHCFLEASVIGLASALYPSADNIQHGDLGKIPEFISTLVSAAPSEIRLRIL